MSDLSVANSDSSIESSTSSDQQLLLASDSSLALLQLSRLVVVVLLLLFLTCSIFFLLLPKPWNDCVKVLALSRTIGACVGGRKFSAGARSFSRASFCALFSHEAVAGYYTAPPSTPIHERTHTHTHT